MKKSIKKLTAGLLTAAAITGTAGSAVVFTSAPAHAAVISSDSEVTDAAEKTVIASIESIGQSVTNISAGMTVEEAVSALFENAIATDADGNTIELQAPYVGASECLDEDNYNDLEISDKFESGKTYIIVADIYAIDPNTGEELMYGDYMSLGDDLTQDEWTISSFTDDILTMYTCIVVG
ncbi:MAG: hypothetical protein Q4B85_04650 [Lachnospiraceae bacterium]|nr:hypothetical protein [Lachnospiraceae bacterium]